MSKVTVEERFWAKVIRPKNFECWLWNGAVQASGYGLFTIGRRNVSAHRFAYALASGKPIPKGMFVLHSCDVRPCVRPSHLRLGTAAENTRDMVKRRRHYHGERVWNARLTADDVRFIRGSCEPGVALARQLGVSVGTISAIRTGKNWKGV